MKFEYYYLFGLDVPLDKYNLGTIVQPKLKDFISNKIELEMFYMPFLYLDMIVGKSENGDELRKIIKEIGSFNFLLKTFVENEKVGTPIFISMLNSLKIIYKTENVKIDKNANIVINENVIINNDNYDFLVDIIFEMLKIDRSKIKFEKEDLEGITSDMLEAKRKYLERNKKRKRDAETLTILDVANIVIQENNLNHEYVLNMTIYQIKNSFEFILDKESSSVDLLYRISPKYENSKDKFNHWTEKIKIDKSTLSRND